MLQYLPEVKTEPKMEQLEEKVNFHYYVESAKSGKIPWDFFESVMKDVCTTLPKSRQLNVILIRELRKLLDGTTKDIVEDQDANSRMTAPNVQDEKRNDEDVDDDVHNTSIAIIEQSPEEEDSNKVQEIIDVEEIKPSILNNVQDIIANLKPIDGKKLFGNAFNQCLKCKRITNNKSQLKIISMVSGGN